MFCPLTASIPLLLLVPRIGDLKLGFDSTDWASIWDQQIKLSLLKWEDADFWHTKAQLPLFGVKTSNYTDQLLSKMKLSSENSVLDVGCGTGTVSIPLAKKVRCVTALDSDPSLLPVLTQRCISDGIPKKGELKQKDGFGGGILPQNVLLFCGTNS